MAHGHACWSMCLRAVAKDRHNNNWALLADAATIRADAGSVGHDSDCCAVAKQMLETRSTHG